MLGSFHGTDGQNRHRRTEAGGPAMTGPPASEGHYGQDLFEPEHPEEAERIDAAALVYDPVTTGRLRALGAGPGSRCLEVGAGTGTVVRWLLEEAGAAEVVALDRDTGGLD